MTTGESEILTAEERERMRTLTPGAHGARFYVEKALRIIDAHAAERATLVERAERAEARLPIRAGSVDHLCQLLDAAESERNALAATLERVRAERDAAYGVLKHVRPGHLPSHVRPQLRSIGDAALAGAPAPEGETK